MLKLLLAACAALILFAAMPIGTAFGEDVTNSLPSVDVGDAEPGPDGVGVTSDGVDGGVDPGDGEPGAAGGSDE
jgi:hypothetical protein